MEDKIANPERITYMPKEEDIINECGHSTSERLKALKQLPSAICPACLLERITKLEDVIRRCIKAMAGSNCLEQKWLEDVLEGK